MNPVTARAATAATSGGSLRGGTVSLPWWAESAAQLYREMGGVGEGDFERGSEHSVVLAIRATKYHMT